MNTWFVARLAFARVIDAQLWLTAHALGPDGFIPEPDPEWQAEQIRINAQALALVVSLAVLTVVAIYLLNRRAGQRRYAAHQAQLLAEGRADRSSALSDVANGRPLITDDAGAVKVQADNKASVFGENYRPIDMG